MMTIHNNDVADILNQLADLLEIKGENPFRVRAYKNAARVIISLQKDVNQLIAQNFDFSSLPSIGKDLAEKIETIVKTGELPLLIELKSSFPPVLTELLMIEGLGPKRVLTLYKKLKIKNMEDLKKAIAAHKISKLKGFGEKTEEKINQGLQHLTIYNQRIKLTDATPIVNNLLKYLKKSKLALKVECAGSFRRKRETLGDLDIVASTYDSIALMDYFVKFPEIAEICSKGPTRTTIRLQSGLQVDLRAVEPKHYGATLLYFTGSKAHNIALRKIAMQKKLKLNEYGIYKKNKFIVGTTEDEIYDTLGLAFISPELRENRGEIEVAQANYLSRKSNGKQK